MRWWCLRPAIALFAFCLLTELVYADEGRLILVIDDADKGAAIARSVITEHRLTLKKGWSLSALDVYCAEVGFSAGRDASVAAMLRADGRVSAVQARNFHAVAGMPPKDPYFDLQRRTVRDGVSQVLVRGSGKGVRIAVIDTGVDITHTELAGQVSDVVNFVGQNTNPVPGEFHGTGVVGLIAAKPGNGVGIHGLAPDAEIVALRACWEPAYGYGLCSTDTLSQALNYAIEIRARIINLSLAGPEDPLLARLVERAIELGAVVFGAVGEDLEQNFPAAVPDVIAVQQGTEEQSLQVAGPRLMVPGQQLLTTVPGNRYDFVSGSSFATAHASGVAAVMLEQQPHLRGSQLVEWLQRLHGNQIASPESPDQKP